MFDDQNSQECLFEEDYLIRSLGSIAHNKDIALTELVANAWDAGAHKVTITIPESKNDKMIIEDDGTGLSEDEFYRRWMKLGYNREKHQGKHVKFPNGRSGNRLAYGKNGVGRHGLLCFNDEYKVTTRKDGSESIFKIATKNEQNPFYIKEKKIENSSKKIGTRLEVDVKRNLPDPERTLDVLAARFIHDPSFEICINGQTVNLEDHIGLLYESEQKVSDNITLKLYFLDTTKAARSTLYQGVAFWQAGRLVGEPSWVLGDTSLIDGRTRFAKKYTIIVKSNDLADYILSDWSGFKQCNEIEKVFETVKKYTEETFKILAKDKIDETKSIIKEQFQDKVNALSPLGQYEVDEVIEDIALNHPTARSDSISLAVEAVINLEKTRSGQELLQKLATLSDEDIEGLNNLLDQWTVKDALSVLDEIDRRFTVLEAIKKLSSDKSIDELKVLHPLITEARWVFGPEFDTPEYTSNQQLQTAAKELFKIEKGEADFLNPQKRPDIVVKGDSTISVTAIDSLSNDSALLEVSKILIVELKRGGFKITRKERDQAHGYVEDFATCGAIVGKPFINCFVVGQTYDASNLVPTVNVGNNNEIGRLSITTFSQIVDTAEKRLFNLKNKIQQRYDDVPGMELFKKFTQANLL